MPYMQFKNAAEFIIQKLRNELSPKLSYHSVAHVLDVYDAAEKIGKAETISAAEMKLVLTAAAYHDSGFLKGAKNHEEESCRIVRENLPGFDYQPNQIDYGDKNSAIAQKPFGRNFGRCRLGLFGPR
ncbi:HD domain-containing protein [uncultured Mucilaginibacter sp.]|uniref:HD domain-containing protein n=1 Tax=uncultured Mucilaginibacter sp. TaxID=797541 RepID=UPI00260D387E|nr:HD domain-containing protein [uncultured Mucilaginibacter sp.]